MSEVGTVGRSAMSHDGGILELNLNTTVRSTQINDESPVLELISKGKSTCPIIVRLHVHLL